MDAAVIAQARYKLEKPLKGRSVAVAIALHLALLLFFINFPFGPRGPLGADGMQREIIRVVAISRANADANRAEDQEAAAAPPEPADAEPTPSETPVQEQPPPVPDIALKKTETQPEPVRPEPQRRVETRPTPPRAATRTENRANAQGAAATPSQATAQQSSAEAASEGSPLAGAVVPLPMPSNYLMLVSRMISRNLNYPSWSRRFHEEGTVVVRIRIARDGRLLDAQIVNSSSFEYLDAEAQNVMHRISRFPPIAPSLYPDQSDVLIDQPVRFRGR